MEILEKDKQKYFQNLFLFYYKEKTLNTVEYWYG